MRADGSRRHRISDGARWDSDPTYFPGGKRTAFDTPPKVIPAPSAIATMRIDESYRRRLTRASSRASSDAAFSSSGDWLLIRKTYPPLIQLLAIGVDGLDPTPINFDSLGVGSGAFGLDWGQKP